MHKKRKTSEVIFFSGHLKSRCSQPHPVLFSLLRPLRRLLLAQPSRESFPPLVGWVGLGVLPQLNQAHANGDSRSTQLVRVILVDEVARARVIQDISTCYT